MRLPWRVGKRLAGTGVHVAPYEDGIDTAPESKASRSAHSDAPGTVLAGAAGLAEGDGANSRRILLVGAGSLLLFSALLIGILHADLPRHDLSPIESQITLIGAVLFTIASVIRLLSMVVRRGVSRVPYAAGAIAVHVMASTTNWILYAMPNTVTFDMVTGMRVDLVRLAEWTCTIFVRGLQVRWG